MISIANLESCSKRCSTLLPVRARILIIMHPSAATVVRVSTHTHILLSASTQKDLSMIVNTLSTLRSKHIQHICHLPYVYV